MRNIKHNKLFVGRKIRSIREEHSLTQAKFAAALGISTSYLNQIENSQRHITAPVLIALAEQFGIDVAMLSDSDSDRVLVDMAEVFKETSLAAEQPSQSELRLVASNAPGIAQTLINLHHALKRTSEQVAELGMNASELDLGLTPYEEVRDFFHYHDNYNDELDQAAERLAGQITEPDGSLGLEAYLKDAHNISVELIDFKTPGLMRVLDRDANILRLNVYMKMESRRFRIAHTIAQLEHAELIQRIVADAGFKSTDAENIARISLTNYFAGAVILPYNAFIDSAASLRHDLILLSTKFGASIEQVAHRLSNLQRPGNKGLPFFFARVDQAGNITKRHSATRLQFARFGSACPLWNVHGVFSTPDQIHRQLAQTPDGAKYLCLALAKSSQVGGFDAPIQRYALALGCSIDHADRVVYSDGLDMSESGEFQPIGISCRLCERENCHQRSMPPLQRKLTFNPDNTQVVPFQID